MIIYQHRDRNPEVVYNYDVGLKAFARRIVDLDDGVKVNYGKFQDVGIPREAGKSH